MKYQYHAMHMHLHCGHQAGASMESHMYNAQQLGMHYIRFTPHDSRTGPRKNIFRSFDFNRGTLVYEDYPELTCGWLTDSEDPNVVFENGAMIMSESNDTDEYQGSAYIFDTTEKRHMMSLLADVTLTLGLDLETVGDARLVFDVSLSQRPPDHLPAHLCYVIGDTDGIDMPHTALIPLGRASDGIYRLDLSQDVQREDVRDVVGGLDNAFGTITIKLESKNGGKIVCKFYNFEIDFKYSYDDCIKRQRVIGDEIGKKYGIKPFVTTEISSAGQHKNCFSTDVPVIDYSAHNYNVTQDEAIAHVKKYGGIFSYNHPFSPYKRMQLTEEEKEEIFKRDLKTYCETKLFGASLIEVAFLKGYGRVFSFQHHLRLWDQLNLAGVFVTAYGDSDAHGSDSKWFDGNNFVAWIAADAKQPFPVPNEMFLDSMKAGRLYTGDPVYIKGQVRLSIDGKPMGAIIPVNAKDNTRHDVVFTAENCQPEWTTRVVIDGEVVQEFSNADIIDENGKVTVCFDLQQKLPVSLARVEMYAGKRCILLTNPVYLVSTEEFSGEIPAERIYK